MEFKLNWLKELSSGLSFYCSSLKEEKFDSQPLMSLAGLTLGDIGLHEHHYLDSYPSIHIPWNRFSTSPSLLCPFKIWQRKSCVYLSAIFLQRITAAISVDCCIIASQVLAVVGSLWIRFLFHDRKNCQIATNSFIFVWKPNLVQNGVDTQPWSPNTPLKHLIVIVNATIPPKKHSFL